MSAATTSAPPITEILPDLDQVVAHFNVLNGAGEVREVRVLNHVPPSGFGGPSTASGYFDNGESVARELRGLGSQHAEGVYITQNPTDPELLARANNRLKRKAKHTSTDTDIIRLAHLTIDCDPVRKAGISATDDELARATARRDDLIQFATAELGWTRPVVSMMSGNGAQVTWRVDLPADDESVALVTAALEAFDAHFSADDVSIDTTLSNPSRLIKLCGTVAGKGDPLAHRPHRQSRGEFHPNSGIVSVAQLRALVALVPEPTHPSRNGRTLYAGSGDAYDIPALLRAAGIGFTEHTRGEMQVYRLDCCLNSDAHTDGAAIIQLPSGAVAYRCHHNTCAGVGWQDIKQRLGLAKNSAQGSDETQNQRTGKTYKTSSDGFDGDPDRPNADIWSPRQPLPAEAPPVPTLPAAMVPAALRPWLVNSAERVCLPLEMVTVPAIVGAGAVVGRAVGIRPGQFDDFLVVPNLWGAVVERPGRMKTSAIAEALRPLGRLIARAHEEYLREAEQAAVSVEAIDAEIAAIRKQMTKAATDGAPLDDLKSQLATKRQERQEATVTERRYVTHDATVEKLGELLRENPRGLLLNRDELSGWLRTLEKAGREGDREFFLESWNGTGKFTTDRIGRGTIHIPALTLSLLGGIQPGKLRPLITDALDGGAGDDGLLQRLQLLVWPDRLPPWEKPTAWPDASARETADGVFDRLDALVPSVIGATTGDEIPFVRFSPGAQAIFDQWRDELEGRLRSDDLSDTPAFAAHIAKYRSLLPALALIFELIDAMSGGQSMYGQVGEAATRLAAAWCEFLECHARKLYAVELAGGVGTAHLLAAKIEAGAIAHGDSVRAIYLMGWSGLKTPDRVLAGLSVLADHGWVRLVTRTSGAHGGRPSQVVYLHPELRAQATEDAS